MNDERFGLLMQCIFYCVMIICLSTCTVLTHEKGKPIVSVKVDNNLEGEE